MTIRLVLVDDHPITLEGLAQLFSTEPDFEVVARATSGEEGLKAVRRLLPDIVVLDLRMPEMDGFAVLLEMQRLRLPTRTVVLTALDDEEVLQALYLGARGVVLKDMASRLVVQCIRTVHAGGKWVEKGVATSAVEKLLKREEKLLKREAGARTMAETLTPREMEVARMIASGLPSKAVASEMDISEGTARLHLHHVYEKLNLSGRVALVRYMQRQGLD